VQTSTVETDETRDSNGVRVVRTSADGTDRWSRTYGDVDVEFADWMAPATDGGGFVVGGSDGHSGRRGARLLRVDTDGGVAWSRTYEESHLETLESVTPTADGGFLAVGSHSSMGGWLWESEPEWALKLDADGQRTWHQTYGSGYPEGVVAEPAGGGVVAFRDGGELHLGRLSSAGETEWRSAYPRPEISRPRELVRTDDGYAILGSRLTGSIGDYGLRDVVLAKVVR
jgi:hypothetical protein